MLTTLCYIEKDEKYLMLHRVKKENITIDEALGIVAVAKALNGDFAFWKEIRETLEGKDAQTLELKGKVTLEDLLKKAEGKSDY